MVVDMSCIDNNHLHSEGKTSVPDDNTGSMPHLPLLSVPEMLGKRELPMHMICLCMWPAMHHDSTAHMQSQSHPFGRAHCIWRTAQLKGEVLTQNR